MLCDACYNDEWFYLFVLFYLHPHTKSYFIREDW
jgi:hypothetical protein